jgi:hypothetical protein
MPASVALLVEVSSMPGGWTGGFCVVGLEEVLGALLGCGKLGGDMTPTSGS